MQKRKIVFSNAEIAKIVNANTGVSIHIGATDKFDLLKPMLEKPKK
jgi:hypothetical protein